MDLAVMILGIGNGKLCIWGSGKFQDQLIAGELKTLYLITINVDHGGSFYITAKDAAGPWS